MKKTAVIYWSGTGNTEAMANAVAEGMREAGAECAVWTPADVGADAVKDWTPPHSAARRWAPRNWKRRNSRRCSTR